MTAAEAPDKEPEARQLARQLSFSLANPPERFAGDPFEVYDALLAHAPVLRQPGGCGFAGLPHCRRV